MGLTHEIASAAGVSVKIAGSLELVAWVDVAPFLKMLHERRIAVVGVEGFKLNGTRVEPDMNAIADFSGIPHDEEHVATSILEAKRFLHLVGRPELLFDFLLEEQADRFT